MPAEVITVKTSCRKCGAALTLEELHYYDNGDDTATCNRCEAEWMEAMDKWKSSQGAGDMPPRP